MESSLARASCFRTCDGQWMKGSRLGSRRSDSCSDSELFGNILSSRLICKASNKAKNKVKFSRDKWTDSDRQKWEGASSLLEELCFNGRAPLVRATTWRGAVEENVQIELQQDLKSGFRIGRVDSEENVQGIDSSDNRDNFIDVLDILKIEDDKFRYHKVPKLKALKLKLEPTLVLRILKHKEVRPSTAWKFFVWAKKQMGYKHTGQAYNTIIVKLLEVGKFTSIYFLLEDMYKDGVSLLPETCVRMAKTFGRAGMVERAINSLKHMTRLGSPATTHHLNSLVTELLKGQHHYKAYIAYREMAKVGCEPDGLTFKSLLRDLARVGKVELACRIFDDMQARGCEPDAETASIVVGILCQSGRIDDAIDVFEKVKERRIKLNAKVYNNLLAGLGETGKFEKALEILEEMHLHGYRPEKYSIATIVDLLANRRKEEAHHSAVSRISQVPSLQQDSEIPSKLVSIKDYMEQAPAFVNQDDTGPPRWFCPLDTAGSPPDAPILLFLPGMDSTGLGLLLHQRKLSRLFEVQILHIPLSDRTHFEGLLEIVEAKIREEYDRKPSPIYLMAESFGCTLAFSVAARNPDLDLVLVIANPATSFERSPLQPLIPLLQFVPDGLFYVTPYLLSYTMGNPVKMASASIDRDLPPWERLPKVAQAMRDLLPTLPILADIMPRKLLAWKVRLLNDGARYANARLRHVKNDILLLASGDDRMIPSFDEAKRLKAILPQIKARAFPTNGHTLLLEDGVDVATLIKQTQMLRHRKHKKFDPVNDYRFPTQDEITRARSGGTKILHQIFSPIFLSATENGRVRRGLPQLPEGKPLLFVSNHTLIGFDLGLVVEEVLVKKGILLRGLAHPLLNAEPDGVEESAPTEVFKLFGTVPVNGANLYKLLSKGEAALLYPGGVREALKRKGEMYKLFWSETAEFVRTAIRHGATIVPFASVGGDDIVEIVLDNQDLLSLPFLNDMLRQNASQITPARTGGTGAVTEETFVTPLGYPKSPPRCYFMFKQPISTDGMRDSINDKAVVDQLYRRVKTDVESGLEYILRKRKEDPYKDFLPRVVYEATNDRQAPTFDF